MPTPGIPFPWIQANELDHNNGIATRRTNKWSRYICISQKSTRVRGQWNISSAPATRSAAAASRSANGRRRERIYIPRRTWSSRVFPPLNATLAPGPWARSCFVIRQGFIAVGSPGPGRVSLPPGPLLPLPPDTNVGLRFVQGKVGLLARRLDSLWISRTVDSSVSAKSK